VDARTDRFGRWAVTTDARILQLDIPDSSSKSETLFELDFDHSYKDAGQKSIHTTVEISFDANAQKARFP
jgi:hypothetical protein